MTKRYKKVKRRSMPGAFEGQRKDVTLFQTPNTSSSTISLQHVNRTTVSKVGEYDSQKYIFAELKRILLTAGFIFIVLFVTYFVIR